MTTSHEDRFNLLPVISDAVRERVIAEMDEFNRLTPEARTDRLEDDLVHLRERNEELANAVEGLGQGPLDQDYVSDSLSHSEWLWLRSSVRFAFVMMLRALNEARREEMS